MANYTCSQLEQLWIQAGGASAVAGLMASIAMAESSGNPGAVNPQSGATGLWQIYPPQAGSSDPLTNAQQAVQKYNNQGLGAWDASKPVWSVQQPCGGGAASPGAPGGSGASTGGNISTLPSRCIYSVQILGGQPCMDGPLGIAAAGLGVLAMIAGLAALAGRFSLPGGGL